MHLRTQKPLFCGWLTYRTILPVVSCPDQFLRLIGPTEARCAMLRQCKLSTLFLNCLLLYLGVQWPIEILILPKAVRFGQIIIMQSIVAKVIIFSTQHRKESWIWNIFAIERAHILKKFPLPRALSVEFSLEIYRLPSGKVNVSIMQIKKVLLIIARCLKA